MALGKRREFEVFTLSFLDCICCGFGAIILLLVVTEYGDPVRLEVSKEDLEQQVVRDEAQLAEIRGSAMVLTSPGATACNAAP